MTPRHVTTVLDNSAAVIAAIDKLANTSVMVGVPSGGDARRGATTPISNAALAYIHEHGEPLHNIPARPFLVPGIRAVQRRVMEQLKRAGMFALKGDDQGMWQQLHSAGLVASQSCKRIIRQGIPPPLKPATVRARLRRTARGQKMLRTIRQSGASLAQWGASNMKPLIDTSQLLRSITYVLRIKNSADVKATSDSQGE